MMFRRVFLLVRDLRKACSMRSLAVPRRRKTRLRRTSAISRYTGIYLPDTAFHDIESLQRSFKRDSSWTGQGFRCQVEEASLSAHVCTSLDCTFSTMPRVSLRFQLCIRYLMNRTISCPIVGTRSYEVCEDCAVAHEAAQPCESDNDVLQTHAV